jgi:cell wall assembly regulator SMI1
VPRSSVKTHSDLAADWAAIERWLDDHAPPIRATLRESATSEQIHEASQAVNATLPADVRASYGIHDGQTGGPPLFGEWALLSLADMTTEWRALKSLLDDGTLSGESGATSGPVRDDWWHPKWIPFASNSSGDFYCLDLAPLEGGVIGQVISYWHADARREVLAPGFGAWLHAFREDLEAGRYQVVDGWLERAP